MSRSARGGSDGTSSLESESARLSLLARVLESFTETIELEEVLRRVVDITREEFAADRCWLLYPVRADAEFATVTYESTSSAFPGAFQKGIPIPLAGSRALLAKAIESKRPVATYEGDPVADSAIWQTFQIRSQLVQVLRPSDEELWAFGLHQCSHPRRWTRSEIELFEEIGRYATVAINNAQLHRQVSEEAAKISAILDQIPQPAAIYDARGRLERMNAAAHKQVAFFAASPEDRLAMNRHRYLDGRPLTVTELPSVRATRGEVLDAEYLLYDPRTGSDRVVDLKAGPIRDEDGAIIGAILLSADVTEEHQRLEREAQRRRFAESLATLGLDLVAQQTLGNLDDAAARIGQAMDGYVAIYLYQSGQDQLELVGSSWDTETGRAYRDYISEHPFKPGDGIPGTVFQIGRPLFFSEIRGDAVTSFARTEEERRRKGALAETSLIAVPIESYGERAGVLQVSRSEGSFAADDIGFAQSVAERIGAVSHIHSLTRIAQEGHRAAEELARREVDARARFEAVLDSAPIGIAVVSADELRFEMANPRWLEFAMRVGRATDETSLAGLYVPDVVSGLDRVLVEAAERGETKVQEAVEFRSFPQSLYFNIIVSPVRGRFTGTTQSLTVLVQDVTEQVRAKREIEALAQMMEERSARLDSILGSMTDALWVFDANGMVVDVNQAALTMFGLASRSEAVSRGSFADFDLRYPDGRKIPLEDLPHTRALSGETIPDYLALGRHLITGQNIDLSIAVAPVASKSIVGAVLVIRDITGLQELDRKKDEFLSVASHELRTPLTTIKGYAQLLASIPNDIGDDDRSTYLGAVLGEVERMMGLISELLDVSRIETNRLQIQRSDVRWIDFVANQVTSFRLQNQKRMVAFNSKVDAVTLRVDADRMRQVLDNLISNALKYSADDSPIDIEVHAFGDRIETSVVDRGIGIPRDELPQLFERFHRARNVSSRYYGGLGLGLYIANAIVQAHGGEIRVESEEGQGSSFTISMPREST